MDKRKVTATLLLAVAYCCLYIAGLLMGRGR